MLLNIKYLTSFYAAILDIYMECNEIQNENPDAIAVIQLIIFNDLSSF